MSPSQRAHYNEKGEYVGLVDVDAPAAASDGSEGDEYTDLTYADLVEEAKERGVGKHGDKRVELEAALRADDAEAGESPADGSEGAETASDDAEDDE